MNEAHSTMRNVLIEELDPRVRLLTGNHKPFGMMEGIQRRPDLVAFVGYHAGPGESGVLSHTFVAAAAFEVTLNGRPMTEGYLNGLLAAEHGARLALVAGDDLTCADADDYAPKAQKVAVKEAVDRYSALCLTPARTATMLRSAAAAGANTGEVPPLPDGPYRCEVTFVGTSSATMAGCVPTVERLSPAHGGVHQGHDRRAVPVLPGADQNRRGRRRVGLRLSGARAQNYSTGISLLIRPRSMPWRLRMRRAPM